MSHDNETLFEVPIELRLAHICIILQHDMMKE